MAPPTDDYSQVQTRFELPHPELPGVSVLYQHRPGEKLSVEGLPISSAQYVMSTKGSPQLCLDGFTFTRHIVKDDTIYWRCIQFRALRCPARHRQRRSTGALEVVWAKHNHGILERRKRGTLREILLQRKRKHQQPVQAEVEPQQPPTIGASGSPIPEEAYAAEYLLAELEGFVLKN